MELGTNITAKLEPFMLMSKSAKGAAAAKLIQDATSASGVFVFAELLEQPNIQEVCNIWSLWNYVSLYELDRIVIHAFSWRTANSMHNTTRCCNSLHTRHIRTTFVECICNGLKTRTHYRMQSTRTRCPA